MSKKIMRREAEASTSGPASTNVKDAKKKKEIEGYYKVVLGKITEMVDEGTDMVILRDTPERDKEIESLRMRGDLLWKRVSKEKDMSVDSLNSEYPEWIKMIHDGDLTISEVCRILLDEEEPDAVESESEEASGDSAVSEPDEAPEDVVAEPEPVVPEAPKKFGEFMAEVYAGDKEKPFKAMLYPSPDKEFFACYATNSGGILLRDKKQAEEFLERGLEIIWMRVERVYEPWVPGKERKFKYRAIEKYCDL